MSKTSVRWCFNLPKWSPTYQELLLATACVQPEEKLRLGKFVFNKDFKSSLIGRLLMRKFVSEGCNLSYSDSRFSRSSETGRPAFSDVSDVNFNVSHQGDYTVLAGEIGSDLLLGIDLMKLEYTGGKPLNEFFRIMTKNFSTQEWKQIYESSDKTKQTNTFCRLWSLKESYTKAISVGITINLNDLSFELASPLAKGLYVNDTKLFVRGEEMREWHFQETLLDDSHCVSIATNKRVPEVEFKELNFGDLMENAKTFLPQDESYCLEYFKKPEKPF